jgi:hypothetical protein
MASGSSYLIFHGHDRLLTHLLQQPKSISSPSAVVSVAVSGVSARHPCSSSGTVKHLTWLLPNGNCLQHDRHRICVLIGIVFAARPLIVESNRRNNLVLFSIHRRLRGMSVSLTTGRSAVPQSCGSRPSCAED